MSADHPLAGATSHGRRSNAVLAQNACACWDGAVLRVELPVGVPESAADEVHRIIDSAPPHRARLFLLRANRYWSELYAGVHGVYPDADRVAGRLLVSAARAYLARPGDLHLHDACCSLEPDWFQQPDTIGYAAYPDRLARPGTGLAGVAERIPHLTRLGVRYLHLMPLLATREGPADGGYAVADYRAVRPDLGTTEDLRELARALCDAGISLCLDLVLNHVAREHPWAQAARAGDPHYRAYFHVFDDRTMPDRYEQSLPEVFPAFAPGNFSFDDQLDGWVWTTFNDYQWDLNWANPDVLVEMADGILFLANLGVGVLRLDAIAFIWKRLGTTCQNQPEVHAITRALRAMVRIACPSVLFKAEAIVGPDDLAAYLGQGKYWGKVSDLAYHNSLMVHIWSMLATRQTRLAVTALSRLPAVAGTTAWVTYLRCHDDIGWAIDDKDADDVGLDGAAHRHFLSDFYAGHFPGTFADGLVFQENVLTGDRRISGTAASLAGLGQRTPEGASCPLAPARLLLAHTIVLGFGGLPVLWSGDEIAELNDEDWAADPHHADDNRWAHRPRLRDDVLDRLDTAEPPEPAHHVWTHLREVIAIRGGLPQLHASWPSKATTTPDNRIFGVIRDHPEGRLLQLYNVSEDVVHLPHWWLRTHGIDPWTSLDHLQGHGPDVLDDHVVVQPYQSLWLTN